MVGEVQALIGLQNPIQMRNEARQRAERVELKKKLTDVMGQLEAGESKQPRNFPPLTQTGSKFSYKMS